MAQPYTKACTECHAEKAFEDFALDSRTPTGRTSKCRVCIRRKTKAWYDEHKTESNRVRRAREQTLPYKFSRYARDSVKRGISFRLTFKQFAAVFGKPCRYCGMPGSSNGLDRVDNTRGYEPDNVVPCCIICNRMKSSASMSEFFAHCARIVAVSRQM